MRDFDRAEIPAHLLDYFEEVVPETGGRVAHPT